jgi:Holliday junction resolvase RusA-like endonuclease
MDRNRFLLSLAEKIELAYQAWRAHPNDVKCQERYELVKTELDNELKQYKDASYQKHHH